MRNLLSLHVLTQRATSNARAVLIQPTEAAITPIIGTLITHMVRTTSEGVRTRGRSGEGKWGSVIRTFGGLRGGTPAALNKRGGGEGGKC